MRIVRSSWVMLVCIVVGLLLAFAVLELVLVSAVRTGTVDESLVDALLVLVPVPLYCHWSSCWAIASVGGRGRNCAVVRLL